MRKLFIRALFSRKLLLILVTTFVVTACGTYSESVQVDDKAFLLLIGDPDGYVVTIDDGKPMDLAKDTHSFSLNGKQATKIEVSTGSHTVLITKDGAVTVNRKFFVSTGTSFEVAF